MSDPTPDPDALRRTAEEIAVETAALAREVRARVVAPAGGLATKSSPTDVVTEGDRACEDLVRRRLAERRPHDTVLGEEAGFGEDGGEAPADPAAATGVRWVVDPIDGTVNYTHGFPWFAVSVGVELAGHPIAGAVVEPVSGRVWSAARGRGATLDGTPLHASTLERLDLAVIGTGLGYDPRRRARQAALLARVAGTLGDVRRTGCASLDLCAVAAGWLDGYYEHGLQPWDHAAGALVAQEAGAWVHRPVPAGADDLGLGPAATVAAAPGLAAALTGLLADAGAAEV